MHHKPLLKICGMRDGKNIQEIGSLNPDYMGFIAYPLSKRFVSEKPQFLDRLSKKIQKVGVFVNPTKQEIIDFASMLDLQVIQLHGNESANFCREIKSLGFKVWKTFSIHEKFNFRTVDNYLSDDVTDAYLFDTQTSSYGGSGRKFDWELLKYYDVDKPFWLSGGLGPADVSNWTHQKYFPSLAGLDLNSAFESTPGIKNFEVLKNTLIKYRTL